MAEHTYRLSDTAPVNRKDPTKKHFTVCDKGNRYPVYFAENPKGNTVLQYRIDGDLIKDRDVQKCDFLLQNNTLGTVYLVELKGHALATARRQIENTERMLRSDLKGSKVYYRIVYKSGTQSVRSAAIVKWMDQNPPIDGRKKIIIKEKQLTEIIS